MAFRELIDDIDDVVFETLGDSARIEGYAEPVLGMFSAPWRQVKFGKATNAPREPRFEIRVSDAGGLSKGLVVSVDVPVLDGGGDYDLVQLEPSGDGLVALILRKRP
ncbi:hypothetical protein SAMN04487857_111112 [Pseudomonas sp. ok272]|uniref:head-tail joining protein n=1 Tax=unclassified Pseudomonas TaxID=196821 RepID=UPI0008CB22F1|nr:MULTISPECIES: hypothetical protein [unclassified Pseudomonas]SEN18938.1 hypothetical protein SAMN04487857_111112 [Pseudomonas sp. ok272]SFN10954.1 hypothetical protein SAMN04487858_112112 [Pseudomonas sp. ok602]